MGCPVTPSVTLRAHAELMQQSPLSWEDPEAQRLDAEAMAAAAVVAETGFGVGRGPASARGRLVGGCVGHVKSQSGALETQVTPPRTGSH